MLPKELLDVRRVKGKIIPKFAGEREYQLAEMVLRVFRAGVGKKYGKVIAKLKEIENAKNFRKVRGFVRVLENYCVDKACAFGIDSELEPQKVRMLLFEKGFVTSKKERDRVVEYAAKYFNTTPENIERAMYADRDEELIITDFKIITPQNLIRLYNLSLLQTTLFNALRLTFWASDNHKEIFRAIKWLGLMYDLYEQERLMVDVTGAASMLKMTRKYGTAFAKLIPHILKARKWYLRAEIVDSSRIYILEIDDRWRDMFPKDVDVGRIDYDSSLEEEFARKMRMLGYNVLREPDVVKAGSYAFIPDFAIDIDGERIYLEIAGFWTEEYLKKKIEKIRKANIPLVVVAREDFGEGKDVEGVIRFSGRIPYGDVIRALKKFRRQKNIRGDVVELEDIADIPDGYVLAGKYAVKKELFERIKDEISRANPKTLDELKAILEKHGLGESSIPAFGYRIRWISLGEARLERVES